MLEPRSGTTLLRHQAASLAATAADFLLMAVLVKSGRMAPWSAALVGAATGAFINFSLNRRHTFVGASRGRFSPQATRYALVSSGSALLNAAGEHVGTNALGLPYFAVRIVVAACVALGWNYPLHRAVVFRVEPRNG